MNAGLESPPPYLSLRCTSNRTTVFLSGVNFASGGCGISDDTAKEIVSRELRRGERMPHWSCMPRSNDGLHRRNSASPLTNRYDTTHWCGSPWCSSWATWMRGSIWRGRSSCWSQETTTSFTTWKPRLRGIYGSLLLRSLSIPWSSS